MVYSTRNTTNKNSTETPKSYKDKRPYNRAVSNTTTNVNAQMSTSNLSLNAINTNDAQADNTPSYLKSTKSSTAKKRTSIENGNTSTISQYQTPATSKTPTVNFDLSQNSPDSAHSLSPIEDLDSKLPHPVQTINKSSVNIQPILKSSKSQQQQQPQAQMVQQQPQVQLQPQVQQQPLQQPLQPNQQQQNYQPNPYLNLAQQPYPFQPLSQSQPFQFTIYQPPSFNLEKYDGSTDIKQFIKNFKAAAIVSKWSSTDQINLLEAYLTGCALDTFKTVLNKSNINDVFKYLLEKHGKTADQYLDDFNKLEPKHNETPRSFAHKLKELIDDTFGNVAEKEIILKNKFIRCLPDNIKSFVIYNSKNQTFLEVVEAVELAMPKFNQMKQLEQIDLNYQYINQYNNRRQKYDANRPLPTSYNTPQKQHHKTNSSNDNNKRFMNKAEKFNSCSYCGMSNHRFNRCNLKRKHDEEKSRVKNRNNNHQQQNQRVNFTNVDINMTEQVDPSTLSKQHHQVNNTNTSISNVNASDLLRMNIDYSFPGRNDSIQLSTLIDSASTASFVNKSFLPEEIRNEIDHFILKPDGKVNNFGMELKQVTVTGAFASQKQFTCVSVNLQIKIKDWYGYHKFLVTDSINNDKEQALLGFDFLKSHKWQINNNTSIDILEESEHEIISCSTTQVIEVPANSEKIIKVKLNNMSKLNNKTVSFTPFDYSTKAIRMSNSVDKVKNGTMSISILNYGDKPVQIEANSVLGVIDTGDEIVSIDTYEKQTRVNSNKTNCKVSTSNSNVQCSNPISNRMIRQKLKDLRVGQHLTPKQQRTLIDTIVKFRDAFSWHENDIGRTDLIEHSIKTTSDQPIKKQPYRIAPAQRDILNEQIQRLKDMDLIEESNSPWAAPVVLVKKKDGSYRLCIDYRGLNAVTIKDSYPLPLIVDAVDAVNGSKYFTLLDLLMGYFQVQMNPNDKEKTAFVIQNGLYQLKVMGMGLCNSPATFQRLADKVFVNLNWKQCIVYLDDVIIFAKTFEEHIERLSNVLERIKAANLKCKIEKCKFAVDEVKYLGFYLSKDGLKMDQSKVEAILNISPPKNTTEVKRFMGAVNHYKRFIADLSKIAAPIYYLLRKDQKFNWSNECQQAFETLKQRLTTAPVLIMPDPNKPFHIKCDASGVAIGAELCQIDENEQSHPIAFASRQLSDTERKYTVSEREALAVVWAVQYFKTYIYNKRVIISTDHQPLTTYKHIGVPDGRLKKLLLKIMDLDHDIVFKPGRENNVADLLSRLEKSISEEAKQTTQTTTNDQVSDKEVSLFINSIELVGEVNWYVEQRIDNDLNQLINLLSSSKLVLLNKDYKQYLKQLILSESSILTKTSSTGQQLICVPKHKVDYVLSKHHDHSMAGHFGIKKTQEAIKRTYNNSKIYIRRHRM